jgi:Skp family chaperone for outer membrane proteins
MFDKKGENDHKWRPLSPFKVLFRIAKKEAKAQHKLQKIRRAYVKERTKQQEQLNREIVGLDKLLKESSIDEETHARLKKLLEIGYKQKRQETREKYGLTETLTPTWQLG